MDLIYTIDQYADEPIMTILGEIGPDVKGDQFCRELMFLDTLGKSKINVWIHSEGGSVIDAERIVAAILKSKTKVDTHNLGLCASSACWVFLAGRNRFMMSNAKLMMHPISGVSDPKTHKAFEDSVVTSLSSRSGLTDETIRSMMAATTWLNAKQCEEMGLCKIDDMGTMNTPRKPVEAMNYQDYTSIVNKLIEEKKHKNDIPMFPKLIYNRLKLVEGSNEESVLAAISQIENRAADAENKLVKQETAHKVEVDAITNKLTAAEKERDELKAKFTEIENKAKAETEAAKETKVKEAVASLVKAGKIKNDAKVIEAAEKAARADFDAFNTLYEVMPVNKQGPGKIEKSEGGEEAPVRYTAAGMMAKIAIENKQTRV